MALALRAAEPEPQPTIVECSGLAETTSSDTETIAVFHDNVVVTGNNMTMYCDNLRVVATRVGDTKATLGKYGNFKSLVAIGHVKIIQIDRIALCGKAEVFPGENRVVLSDHPVVQIPSERYEASGPRMVLYRGQRRAVIEGTPTERARLTLPEIKDLAAHPTSPGEGQEPSK